MEQTYKNNHLIDQFTCRMAAAVSAAGQVNPQINQNKNSDTENTCKLATATLTKIVRE